MDAEADADDDALHAAFERGVRIIDLPGYGAAVGIDRKQGEFLFLCTYRYYISFQRKPAHN